MCAHKQTLHIHDVPDGVGRQPVDEISQKQRNRQILEKSAKLDLL